ncbi:MAG TPA: DUF1476 domain-containing protein [Alphaproteobacteria bacterium]
MSGFDDREKTFEKKFEKDQELQFKATARRNRLLGLWAAELMGMKGDAAEAYAKEVVKADFEKPGEEDVIDKVLKDFKSKGVGQSQHQIRRKMDDLFAVAKQQIMTEVKK